MRSPRLAFLAVLALSCRSCTWLPSEPEKPNRFQLAMQGPRVKLYYCSSIDEICEVRAWFADGRDCLDMETVFWSECERKGQIFECRELMYNPVFMAANKTRCSERKVTWADVARSGYRTELPRPH